MSSECFTRRRALTICAGTMGGLFLGGHARARVDFEWRGTAMGADATIIFAGSDETAAKNAAARIAAEIDRLEDALSLFRTDSEIRRLNRFGRLDGPSGDLRRCLDAALTVARRTGGLFDPTVQALWETHVNWLARGTTQPLANTVLNEARAHVGWQRIETRPDRITLGAGQRLTLNGIGQGYVTDRVADLLAGSGYSHVLVDLGEQRALGPRPDGAPWSIARRRGHTIPLEHGALATSEGDGCILNSRNGVHHLFDPRTGRSASHWRRVIVHHPQATMADALSTAFYATTADELADMVQRFAGCIVWAEPSHGAEQMLRAPLA